jgi:hypothetical protein
VENGGTGLCVRESKTSLLEDCLFSRERESWCSRICAVDDSRRLATTSASDSCVRFMA